MAERNSATDVLDFQDRTALPMPDTHETNPFFSISGRISMLCGHSKTRRLGRLHGYGYPWFAVLQQDSDTHELPPAEAISTAIPGPIVELREIFLKYLPLAPTGLA